MNLPRLLTVAIAAVCSLSAAETAPKPPLTFNQEVGLYNAITALDQGGIRNVDGKAAQVAFDFTAHTRLALVRDLQAVTPAFMAIDKTRAAKLLEITGGRAIDKDDPVVNAKMSVAMQAALDTADPAAPRLETITEGDLKLDSNPIPMRLQALLGPIIVP